MNEQGSEAWFIDRAGHITCSPLDKICEGKKGILKTGYDYLWKIIAERDTGVPDIQNIKSVDLDRGTKQEPEARKLYESETFNEVIEVPFQEMNEYFGGSPDGFVGEDGIVEIKCPRQAKHKQLLVFKEVQPSWLWQIQGNLLATGRKWCDFISYNKDFDYEKRLCIIRINRDEDKIGQIKERLDQAIEFIKKHE